MASEKELGKEEKELEEAELQLTKRDLVLEGRMRAIVSKGLNQAKNLQIEEAYQTLEEIRKFMPALIQDLKAEYGEEAGIGKIEDKKEEKRRAEQKGRKREGRADVSEIRILAKISRGLISMGNLISKQGVQKSKIELLKNIEEIRKDTAELISLERLEISEELRDDVIKGATTDNVRNLIKDEKNALSLLNALIAKIEKLVSGNGNPLTIASYIKNTAIIVKKLILINKAELRSVAK